MRNAMDVQEVAIGWWPGDARYEKAAFYGYAHPARPGFAEAELAPGYWNGDLGEYVLDWDVVRASTDPRGTVQRFAQAVFQHACDVCGWKPELAASAEGEPPPIR